MIVCHISDTHGLHRELIMPEADLIIHSGDICTRGNKRQLLDFISWFKSLDFEHKVLVCGNHDFYAQSDESTFRELLGSDVIYLKNEGVMIEGMQLWGSPMNPEIGWAFGRSDMNLSQIWKNIPSNTDILITHMPPHSILDSSKSGVSLGDKELLIAAKNLNPLLHLFGHIHESRGQVRRGATLFSNGTSIIPDFKDVLEPFVVNI